MSFKNRDSLISSLSIFVPLISFSCCVVLPRIYRTMFNRRGETGYPCYGDDLGGKAPSFSPLSMMSAVVFCKCYLSSSENF